VTAALRKTLRPYQARLITDVCRSDGHVLVEQPTGSGKTMQVVTLVAMQLGRRFSHAVIAAPQQQIEEGFTDLDYRYVGFPACQGAAAPDIEVPEHFVWGARNSKQLSSTKRLIAYLRQPGPCDHALACTHAALNCLDPEKLPADLSGKALFIDEAHHASADGLSELVTLWRDRGGRLYFFTATPYRGDGRPVALEDMRLYRRSLAEHMAEGFAPRHLESEIVALGRRGDKVSAGQFTGEEAPPDWNEVVHGVCRRWTEEGRPKTIVRVPPMRGGSAGRVAVLIRALQSQGARVLDATGTGVEDKKRFLAALKAEKNRSHAESRFDVVVGIQRVMEGTDWPVCSAVYCVGMPGSLNTVVQLLGRAMRLKNPDYPEQQRDRARLVFFVPCAGGAALPELSIDHSRHALLTCCFLADHEVGQEWIVLKEIRRGIADVLGSPEQNPAAAEAENDAAAPLDPEVRAEVELVLADAREQIIGQGREPTLSDVVQQAMQARQDVPESAFRQVAVEVLAGQRDAAGATAREAVRREVARRLRIRPEIRQAMEEAFAAVLGEFRDVTLQKSAVLESVGRQVHGMTGGQMREFAQRLRQAVPRPLTEELILEWADAHYERIGEWPKVLSGPIAENPGETWANIHSALVHGLRELPGGSSLAQFLADRRGARNPADLPKLTVEQVLAWADAFHERTNKWPGQESGPIDNAPDETWKGVCMAFVQEQRGLPKGFTLAEILAVHRGVRNAGNLPVLTEARILAWADTHYKRTGEWPKVNSGHVQGAPGERWANINAALEQGGLGFPKGSSLAKLLATHRGKRNRKGLPPLSEDQIVAWADAYYERIGKWPQDNSGAVDGLPGQTWKGVNVALMKGLRGLPGGSCLTSLLEKHRAARNRMNLPALTEQRILAWADAYYAQNMEWPKVKSGPIDDAPGETWLAINHALHRGIRGLSGGSSLAKLLARRRGARNRMNLPSLTVEEILVWSDAYHGRTGRKPRRDSGAINEALGETWAGVDAALKSGVRGLPGGSSLARLIQQHRGESKS
jgi:Type III restriction enzyme, res subunit